MRVGFIGLGRMGKPMARNLMRAGHTLVVWNRSRGPVEELARDGARVAAGAADVARQAEAVLTCVPMPADVEQVYLGAGGILEGVRPGLLCLEMSTIDPGTTQTVGAAAADKGVDYLDAPVSGGVRGAAEASLTIMVGGTPEAFARARPLLEAMGGRIHHMGGVGAGSATKLCNQLAAAIALGAASEAMVLGTKAGLDPRALFDVLHASSGASDQMDRAVPKFVLPRKFEPGFALRLLHKDLDCALAMATHLGVRSLLGAPMFRMLEEARQAGHGGLDCAAVILPLERLAGVQVRAG